MFSTQTVSIRSIPVGAGRPLALIAGPCVIESEAHVRTMARELTQLTRSLGVPFVFKASYDKANRMSLSSYRGPGLAAGLAILAGVKKEFDVPILTDVHGPEQVGPVAEVADVLQVPAFLCRQTDIVLEVGRSGRVTNLKKGQFVAPWDMKHLVEKVHSTGNRQVLLTERGATFGYGQLVVDFRSIAWMHETGCPVVFDATHSVQLPGGQGGRSGGLREMVPLLSRAGVAAGADALFLEVHDDPDRGLSDGPNMVKLGDLPELLRQVTAIRASLAPRA